MTRLEFLSKMATMQPGEKVIYHVGSLLFDRQIGEDFQCVHNLAFATWEAMENGSCALTQRRLMPLMCEYIATKLGSCTPANWRGCYVVEKPPNQSYVRKRYRETKDATRKSVHTPRPVVLDR
jgi:hypothetical protein